MTLETSRYQAAAVAVVFVLLLSACSPGLFRFAAATVLTTAAVAAIMHAHDDHYHHRHCGHEAAFVDGQEVYNYQGRWEYYDERSQTWYTYDDIEQY